MPNEKWQMENDSYLFFADLMGELNDKPSERSTG
jgi:hypothetical protein